MGATIGAGRRLDRLRAKVTENLLPDTCNIFYQTRVIDDAGNAGAPTAVYLSYNGSQNIPCRFDPTRQYRTSDVFGQETLLDDFMVTLPYNIIPAVDYRVIKNGEEFEVRKVLSHHSWNVSSRIMVTKVDRGV